MDELQKQYNTLLVELESLRQENAEMKALLFKHGAFIHTEVGKT